MGLSAQIYAQASDVDCFHCIDTTDIGAQAVTTGKLAKQAVTTSKLAKQAVTTSKIAGSAVTTGKIKNGAITENKLSANLSNAIQGTGRTRVLDGGDTLIGYLVNISDSEENMDVITEQGYVRRGLQFVDGKTRFPGSLVFSSGDCTGQPFTYMPNGFVDVLYDVTGVTNLYYAEKNSIAQIDFLIGSVSNPSGCFATSGGSTYVWPALPNDPLITGASSQTYSVPIKIELPQ